MDKTLNRTQHSVSERRQFRPFSATRKLVHTFADYSRLVA